MPKNLAALSKFWFKHILDPCVLSGLFSAFDANIALGTPPTKFALSYAYPFMCLSFFMCCYERILPKMFGLLVIIRV